MKLDTIGAISTANGVGGIGVIRLSGKLALKIAHTLVGFYPPPRVSLVCFFYDRKSVPIDRGIIVFFKNPYTYTGEDIVELHCHGSAIIIKKLLDEVLYLGARQAQPGEFTARAFLNKKLTLLQVEALSILFGHSQQERLNDSSGVVVNTKQSFLMTLVERFVFFFYVKVDFYNVVGANSSLFKKNSDIFLFYFNVLYFFLKKLEDEFSFLYSLNTKKHVYLLGQTNAGKSSLLNVLSKKVVSLVHKFPGTTRDIVSYTVTNRGQSLVLYDTAGFNYTICNKIELCGLSLLKSKVRIDSVLLLMFDLTEYCSFYANRFYISIFRDLIKESFTVYTIKNKIDYFKISTFVYTDLFACKFFVSAKTSSGVSLLLDNVVDTFDNTHSLGSSTTAISIVRKNLKTCIIRTTACLKESKDYELLHSSLKYCHGTLRSILGQGSCANVEDLFSRFCVGK